MDGESLGKSDPITNRQHFSYLTIIHQNMEVIEESKLLLLNIAMECLNAMKIKVKKLFFEKTLPWFEFKNNFCFATDFD